MKVREWLSGMGKEDSGMIEELGGVGIYDFGSMSLWGVCLGRVWLVWREELSGDGQLDGEIHGPGSDVSALLCFLSNVCAQHSSLFIAR